jgi:hypothetical protein
MTEQTPLIALISATPAAIRPALDGISAELPHARVWNILDDRLLADANEAGSVTPQLERRMNRLIGHALAEGADGILLTCSIYGPVATRFASNVPILAPDDAAFSDVIRGGLRRVLVVASFEAALLDAKARFDEAAGAAGVTIETSGAVAAAALPAANSGDSAALLRALIDACKPSVASIDAVLLAQYSLAPVAGELAAELGVPVFSGPASAARELGARLGAVGNPS